MTLSLGGLSSRWLEEAPDPVAARLDRASLRCEVDGHEPEPPAVPPRPLEVVHQAPHEIPAERDPARDRLRTRIDVALEVVDPARVLDGPVGLHRVVER